MTVQDLICASIGDSGSAVVKSVDKEAVLKVSTRSGQGNCGSDCPTTTAGIFNFPRSLGSSVFLMDFSAHSSNQ